MAVRISVVIAARNAAHTIADCLASLSNQTAPELLHEVIVVDNNSTDDTARVAKEAGATVIEQPRIGAAAARNAGIAAATGDVICVTDADCRPVGDWLEKISEPLRNDPSITACKGTYRTDQRRLFARFVQIEYEDKYDLLRTQESIDFIDTYSAAYRRDALVETGGFDERIQFVEDQELSFRLAEMGCRMVFQPSAVVYHLHADSAYAYLRKKFFIGYWKAKVVRRFPNVIVRDSHTPQVIKVQMLLIMLMGMGIITLPFFTAIGAGLVGGSTVMFLVSTIPFARKAWRSDRLIAVLSPFMLGVRATGLAAGFAKGSLVALRQKPSKDPDEMAWLR